MTLAKAKVVLCSVLISSFLFIGAAVAIAAPTFEQRSVHVELGGLRKIAIVYGEAKKFYVEIFQQRPGRFQDRVASERYSTRWAAEKRFLEITKNWRRIGGRFAAPSALFPLDDEAGRSPVRPDEFPPSEVPGASLWTVRNQWSVEWLAKFSHWIATNIDEEIFERTGLATDCADLEYALTWIFAREHGLPAANRLSGTGALFTQDSMRGAWMSLPTAAAWHQDKRFLAALDYLLDNTYTHMLMRDAYPIAINEAALAPGAFHLGKMAQTGHTQVVANLLLEGDIYFPVRVLYSDVPRKVRKLFADFFFSDIEAKAGEAGFFRMRWPVLSGGEWKLAAPESHPHYSLEQFHPDFAQGRADWMEAVQYRLLNGRPGPSPKTKLQAMVNRLYSRWLDRVDVVTEGYEKCSGGGRCPRGSQAWEDWSTPSRDRVVGVLVDGLVRQDRKSVV